MPAQPAIAGGRTFQGPGGGEPAIGYASLASSSATVPSTIYFALSSDQVAIVWGSSVAGGGPFLPVCEKSAGDDPTFSIFDQNGAGDDAGGTVFFGYIYGNGDYRLRPTSQTKEMLMIVCQFGWVHTNGGPG